MNTFKLIHLTVIVLICFSCTSEDKQIAQKSDYIAYVETEDQTALLSIEADYAFWNGKLKNHPNQFPYLLKKAASLSSKFKITGNIDDLIEAEHDLIEANKRTNYENSGYLRALARNYISQHRFKASLELLKKAESIGEHLKGTQNMLFDVYLELGNTNEASEYLVKTQDFNDFDYVIRLAKWQDHEGNLDAAIKYMEKALAMAESSNNPSKKQWIYTNIADYYGHDGQIEKSYQYYLKALALDPSDAYSKKGIAWIVYSHDKNPEEAMNILNRVTQQHNTPDYELLKAEIAEFMGDDSSKKKYLNKYLKAVNNKKYGDMYNAYNTLVFADDLQIFDSALKLAYKEVENRPTPHSYDLLAWSYYKKGDYKKALQIVETHIKGKSFEPTILSHMAQIYKDNGKLADAKILKKELLDAAYELGPVETQRIKNI
ncbi:tetratricopeptide repeat family protein [Formosa agariphila KMM 3901]|uniref:Tetratricopeptide repeat family protein n=1 Tax=Formosa agariphila (strain DSM 15362 / KCTC 12365 / LMG 23005 / KMM 3901 / M-2Alg 35-1) TaxID=1347342 RepID=T2KLD5_FORAG|nr:tetratricopeptide repeat protein [Formosa agariphila]CDF79712.1 tetratricopeptide repeat family protein [Formosa agariphila KMM 3901]